MRLRAWQARAVAEYDAHTGDTFMVCATPGAGRPVTPSRFAARDFDRRRIAGHRRGAHRPSAAPVGRRRRGVQAQPRPAAVQPVRVSLLTHARLRDHVRQVASQPILHQHRTQHHRTLVILDEVHHSATA